MHPGVSVIEIPIRLYESTPLPAIVPWWVNPAVTVNGHTRTVMPIDVTSILGYGKRDVSRYPIVTGTYYWHDYSQGADISRYKNAPMPTLYMAAHSSNYDFVGLTISRGRRVICVWLTIASPQARTWPWIGSTPYPATSESWQAVIRKGCPD